MSEANISINRNLDADKEFVRMREAGVFQSVKPGGEINTDAW